jgi:hypothetical protein
MKRLLLVLVVGLVLAPAGAAGGWATVQLSAVPSDGLRAGERMGIDITVLQHGRTPLAGVTPRFQILDPSSGEVVREMAGRPTPKPGVYHVDVVFPRAGTFAYQVYDGFDAYGGAQTHTFAPVEIGAAGGRSGLPAWAEAGLVALALLVATGAAFTVLGSRHRSVEAAP